MSETTQQLIDRALKQATAIAFDGCHKIYIAMDKAEAETFRSYGYGEDGSYLREVKQTDAGRKKAARTLRTWWEDSCGLRFISTVRSVPSDPNEGFDHIIAQCDEWVH